MTRNQMEWAKQHDWFVNAREVDGIWFVVVLEVLTGPAIGEVSTQELEFKYYKELRAWAGY